MTAETTTQDRPWTEAEIHNRFNEAHGLYEGAVKAAASRYTRDDRIERRLGEDDLEQECLILLFDLCGKLEDDVNSEDFYAKLTSMLWKRVGREIQAQRAACRDFHADVHGEAGEIAMSEMTGGAMPDCDSPLDVLKSEFFDKDCDLQDLIDNAKKYLDEYEQQVLSDLIQPSDELVEWMEMAAERDGYKMKLQQGCYPSSWIEWGHNEFYGKTSKIFWEARERIMFVFEVLLQRPSRLEVA